MGEEKIYWSNVPDPTNWGDDSADYMTFVLVPSKWWSIKAWKLANEFRVELLRRLCSNREKSDRNLYLKDRVMDLESELAAVKAVFKNFHKNLCSRFNYSHDEQDWSRDLASLEEHIYKELVTVKANLKLAVEALEEHTECLRNCLMCEALSKIKGEKEKR